MENNIIQVKMIRHGDRLDYSNRFYWLCCIGQYWADSPLNSQGYEKSKIKAKKIESSGFIPKLIYTSPYNRTIATATEMKNVFEQAEVIIEPLLAEYQSYRAHTISLYPNGIPTKYNGAQTDFSYPETLGEFSQRTQFIIKKLIEKNDSDIMIVTHGELLKSYVSYLQTMCPSKLLDIKDCPFLTTLSFNIDKTTGLHIPDSIRIEIG